MAFAELLALALGFAGIQSGDLDARLATAAQVSRNEGLSPTGWSQRGTLGEGAVAGFTLRLEAGRTYQLVGACGGCSDLDLQLLDAAGREADKDDLPDDTPVLVIKPVRAQNYVLRVTMGSCAYANCSWGVAAYAK